MRKLLSFLAAVLAGLILTAQPANARTAPDQSSLEAMSRYYHCGQYFHGHTVRGFLVGKSGRYVHVSAPVSAETQLLWLKRGLPVLNCQR